MQAIEGARCISHTQGPDSKVVCRTPYTIWSLDDVLRESGYYYVLLGQLINSVSSYYEPPPKGLFTSAAALSVNSAELVNGLLTELYKVCEMLKLAVSRQLLEEYSGDKGVVPQSKDELDLLIKALKAELKSIVFISLDAHRASYFNNPRITPDSVSTAFPTAWMELHKAAQCYAFELDTACVFHAMRAVEIGLRSMGSAFNIEYPKPIELLDWSDILNPIQARIRALQNTKASLDRDSELEFYSEAASQFQYFKQGWRHRTAHARATYTGEQAKAVLEHAIAFFVILAGRLTE